MPNASHDDFRGIWNRIINTTPVNALAPTAVQAWATDRGFDSVKVEERDVGAFLKTPAIVLTTNRGTACFQKVGIENDPIWDLRHKKAESQAALWEKMEWFSPLWISRGAIAKFLDDVSDCSRARAIDLFNYYTSTLYPISFEAVCIAQILPQSRALKEFTPLAVRPF